MSRNPEALAAELGERNHGRGPGRVGEGQHRGLGFGRAPVSADGRLRGTWARAKRLILGKSIRGKPASQNQAFAAVAAWGFWARACLEGGGVVELGFWPAPHSWFIGSSDMGASLPLPGVPAWTCVGLRPTVCPRRALESVDEFVGAAPGCACC